MFLLRDSMFNRSFSDLRSDSVFGDTTLFTDNPPAESAASNGTGTCCCGGFCAENSHASSSDSANVSYVTDYTALLNPINVAFGDFSRWNGDASGAAVGTTFITYTFLESDELPDPSTVSYSPDAVFSYSDAQRDATRAALEEFAKISGIVFIEVEGNSMMDFVGVTGSGFGGFAFYPFSGRREGGGVYMEGDVNTDFSSGTWPFETLLHEIGHAVGLKHPFQGDVRLTEEVDNNTNTVMSYTNTGPSQTVLPHLDVDAVQFLYGTAEASGKNDIAWSWDETNDVFTATGTSGDDQISGVNFQNNIDAGAGNDIVLGGAADDSLIGGEGNDRLVGAGGTNQLDGGAGNDILVSVGSNDTLLGGDGDDTFFVRFLSNTMTVTGGDGFDVLALSSGGSIFLSSSSLVTGIEEVRGSNFNDTLFGDDGDNRLIGGDGDDRISGGAGVDFLDGGDGYDTLEFDFNGGAVVVDLAANTVSGGFAEGDTIMNFEAVQGGSSTDTILGNDADNVFTYRGGNDIYDGRGGSDTLSTRGYNDIRINLEAETIEFRSNGNYFLFGQLSLTSIENLQGGFGIDVLIGNNSDNILDGGSGDDILTGAGGGDTFIFATGFGDEFGNDIITDFSIGLDIVDLRALSTNSIVSTRVVDGNMVVEVAMDGGDVHSSITFEGISAAEWSRQSYVLSTDFVGSSSNDFYNGTASGDLALGLGGSDTLNGGAGADELYGGDGNDLLFGGDQNDILYGNDGNDQLLGQRGVDVLYGGTGNDLVLGGNRNDRLFGEDGNDRVFGGNDQDTVSGGNGRDIVRGGNGDDNISGDGGNDVMFGGTGRDSISGGDGDDLLWGRGGFDVLNGGAGDDTLEGGLQADQFIFENGFGNDTITDFASLNNAERIDLSGVDAITDFTDLVDNHMSQVGADVLIEDGLGNSITLLGVTLSDLDAVDFVF